MEPAHQSLGIGPWGIYDLVLETMGSLEGMWILDAPGGSGGFAEKLREMGAYAVSGDIVAGDASGPFIRLDLNRGLPFRSASFDMITCIEGIEHVHDGFQLISEFGRLLRPGGTLIVTTPNMQNLRSRIKFLLKGTFFWFDSRELTGVGHVNVIPYFLLVHMLENARFGNVTVRYNRTVFPTLPRFACKLLRKLFPAHQEGDRMLNSSTLLNGEGLIVTAQKV